MVDGTAGMRVLEVDANLLTAGARALEAVIADVAGEPDFLRFEGVWPSTAASLAPLGRAPNRGVRS